MPSGVLTTSCIIFNWIKVFFKDTKGFIFWFISQNYAKAIGYIGKIEMIYIRE